MDRMLMTTPRGNKLVADLRDAATDDERRAVFQRMVELTAQTITGQPVLTVADEYNFLAEALRQLPDDDVASRAAVLVQMGEAALRADAKVEAITALDLALSLCPPGKVRAMVDRALTCARRSDGGDARTLTSEAAAAAFAARRSSSRRRGRRS